MKDIIKHISTSNATYPLVFNLNVMEEIQEHYGSIKEWGKIVEGNGEPVAKDLKLGIMFMINEGIDMENETKTDKIPFVTEKQVGRIISEVGIKTFVETIKTLTIQSTKTEDAPKNE